MWAEHLLHRIFSLSEARGSALVTIFFGANDAALKGSCK